MSYDKLSDEVKIHVMNYLDYETIAFLGNTNKSNHTLYKKLKEKNYIPLYSTKKYYIHKKNKKVNSIFYTLLFIQIISYNKDFITYKHIKYGKYQNYLYPISSYLLYFLSHNTICPSYVSNRMTSKRNFDHEYELYEEYKMYDIKKTFQNNYFFSKFVLQSLSIYLFFYIPILFLLYLFYLCYYLFFITTSFIYIFHICLMYEILLTMLVSRNINHFI